MQNKQRMQAVLARVFKRTLKFADMG